MTDYIKRAVEPFLKFAADIDTEQSNHIIVASTTNSVLQVKDFRELLSVFDDGLPVMASETALVDNIALILDYPSVYMSGPSYHSKRTARKIIDYLSKSGALPVEKEDRETI